MSTTKLICLVVLLIAVATVSEATQDAKSPRPDYHDHDDKRGPCGKFSTERILTHKLRHCEKAARNVYAPVSEQCCKDLEHVSIPCLYAVFSSDAFRKVNVDPNVAVTIPRRCHYIHH